MLWGQIDERWTETVCIVGEYCVPAVTEMIVTDLSSDDANRGVDEQRRRLCVLYSW